MRVLIIGSQNKSINKFKNILIKNKFTVDVKYFQNERELENFFQYSKYRCIILENFDIPVVCDFITSVRHKKIKTSLLTITSTFEDLDIVRILTCGSDDYFENTKSLDLFVAKVKSLIRRPIGYKIQKSEIGNVVLDSNKFLLYIDNTIIYITNIQYKILYLLFEKSHSIATRDTFKNQIWGLYNTTMSSISLTVHINKLRKIFQDNDATINIETVRGIGYKLINSNI